MKIKIVKGEAANRLIENYLNEGGPRKAKDVPPPPDVNGDGEADMDDYEDLAEMDLESILDWDTFAAQQTQGVDGLVDVAFADIPEEINVNGDIEDALDKMFKRTTQMKKQRDYYAALCMKDGKKAAASKITCPNLCLLIEGDAGSGKTARTKDWCSEHDCNILVKMLSSMDETDLGGTPYAEVRKDKNGEEYHVLTKLPATELDDLKRKNSVLFLDEYNRASKSVRNTALKLINEHLIPDARVKGGMRYFPNLLFVVMACNPPTYSGTGDEWDPAEKNRVKHLKVKSDKKVTLKYLMKNYRNRIRTDLMMGDRELAISDYGRMLIAKQVMPQPEFQFDTPKEIDEYNMNNEQTLTARSFEECLDGCDGTPEDFLKEFPSYCGDQPTKIQKIKTCLGNYKDIENKMNELVKQGTSNKNLSGNGFNEKEDEDDEDVPKIQKKETRRNKIFSSAGKLLNDQD